MGLEFCPGKQQGLLPLPKQPETPVSHMSRSWVGLWVSCQGRCGRPPRPTSLGRFFTLPLRTPVFPVLQTSLRSVEQSQAWVPTPLVSAAPQASGLSEAPTFSLDNSLKVWVESCSCLEADPVFLMLCAPNKLDLVPSCPWSHQSPPSFQASGHLSCS